MPPPKKGIITSESLVPDSKRKDEVARSNFQNGSFGDAIRLLRTGGKVKRSNWPVKLHLFLNADTIWKQGSSEAFIYDAIHADLLAKDWMSA